MASQNRCKFCMQPDNRHLVGCPMYKKPEERSKTPNNLFEELFGFNPFDTKGESSK